MAVTALLLYGNIACPNRCPAAEHNGTEYLYESQLDWTADVVSLQLPKLRDRTRRDITVFTVRAAYKQS